MKRITGFLIVIFVSHGLFAEISIDTNYENGSLPKYKITQPDTVFIGPVDGNKDTWFSFKIKGVKHKKINIVLEKINKGALGQKNGGESNETAMVSYDGRGYEIINEVSFSAKSPGARTGNYLEKLTHVFRENEAFVSYCVPYSNKMLAGLADRIKRDQNVTVNSLGTSKYKKLPLTYFRITDKGLPDGKKKKIFIMGREDSYEVGGSWAVEGITRFILSDDPVAKEMLKKMVFYIFPIFSVDGVAIGSTNYPLNEKNTDFVYVTATWNKPDSLPEVKLMKEFFNKLKSSGENIDVSFRHHATCYFSSFVCREDTKETAKDKERKTGLDNLAKAVKNNLFWYENITKRTVTDRFSWFVAQTFPKALTFAYHDDFIINEQYAVDKRAVVRRNEDILCDGELVARSLAEYFGIETKEAAPYIMASNVDKNCGKKGQVVTYFAYYYDLKGLPPEKVEININGKPYKMEKKGGDAAKFLKYEYKMVLNEPVNDYYLTVSNGKKERKVPEDDYLLPGPFIIE